VRTYLALLAAGSDSVLVTLWDVGDAATATFMRQFYHYLGRGEIPSAALRLAKNRLRQHPEWSDPGLWAGYVLIGDSPPIRRPLPGMLPIALVCAALVLSAWLYRKRIRSASKSSVRT